MARSPEHKPRLVGRRVKDGYGGGMGKRIADWLEKFSVLAAGIGVFQGKALGLFVAIVALVISLWITKRLEK